MERIQLISLGLSAATLAGVVSAVRRGDLRVEYALLWLIAAVGMLVLSVSKRVLDGVAGAVGIYYPPSALFLLATFFLLLLVFHLAVVVSRLRQANAKVAQAVALLELEVRELKDHLSGERA